MPLAAFACPTAVALWLALSLTLLCSVGAPPRAAGGRGRRSRCGRRCCSCCSLLWPPVLTNLQLQAVVDHPGRSPSPPGTAPESGVTAIAAAELDGSGKRRAQADAARSCCRFSTASCAIGARRCSSAWCTPASVFWRSPRSTLQRLGCCALRGSRGERGRAADLLALLTLSLTGLWSRLFVGGEFAQPLEAAPLVAQALVLVSASSLLGIAAMRHPRPDPQGDRARARARGLRAGALVHPRRLAESARLGALRDSAAASRRAQQHVALVNADRRGAGARGVAWRCCRSPSRACSSSPDRFRPPRFAVPALSAPSPRRALAVRLGGARRFQVERGHARDQHLCRIALHLARDLHRHARGLLGVSQLVSLSVSRCGGSAPPTTTRTIT